MGRPAPVEVNRQMRRMHDWFAGAALSATLGGCAAGGGTEADPSTLGAAGSTGSPADVAGCTQAPECGSCGTCAERCFCEHPDIAFCAGQCAATGTPTPSTGPSPTSPPSAIPTSMPNTPPAPSASTTPAPTSTTAKDAGAPPPPVLPSITVTTVQFSVPPGGEVFKCQNFRNPLGKDIGIVESESFMAPGSHHMFLFREPGLTTDSNAVEDCSGVEFTDYVHLAQQPQIKWTYPDGVARLLKGTDGLRIAVHYLNLTSGSLTGQVSVTLTYEDPTEARFLAAPIFLNQTLLAVPPGASTASRQFAVPYSIQMIRAVGHMHKRGTNFSAVTNAGQDIYDTTSWDEPVERVFDPPLAIAGGATITWSCAYQNPTATVFTFGESATSNEMCIMYGLFYPTDPTANQGVSLGGLL